MLTISLSSARRIADLLEVIEKRQRLEGLGRVLGILRGESRDVGGVAQVALVEKEVDKFLERLTVVHPWNSVYSTSLAFRRWRART